MENLVGLWGGGALIACFPVHGIGTACDRYQAPGGGESNNSYVGWRKGVFPSTDPGGWLKI